MQSKMRAMERDYLLLSGVWAGRIARTGFFCATGLGLCWLFAVGYQVTGVIGLLVWAAWAFSDGEKDYDYWAGLGVVALVLILMMWFR